jgi:hypothetical protein
MVCSRCGAENPVRAAGCIYCGEPLASRRMPEAGRRETTDSREDEPPRAGRGMAGSFRNGRTAHKNPDVASRSFQTTNAGPERPLDEEEDLFRELFAEVVEINRRIKRQKSGIDAEALSGLYTARSFSTPEAMGRTTGAIRQLLGTNQRLAAELERALERIKNRVESACWSRADKMRFWNKIADGFLARFRMRPAILEKQARWTEATVELYEFVLAHSDELSFEGKTVQTSDRETGEEFVRRLRQAKRFRDAFRTATETRGEIRADTHDRRRRVRDH